jgi:anthranilate synthase component 1
MKKLTLLILALALAACSKPSIGAGTKAQYDAMNIESMKEVLTYISSDEMRGRDTGSDELKKVADFLARELNSYGYKGLGESGSFLQPINMYSRKHKHETLSLQYDGKALKFKSGEDVILYARSKPSLDFNSNIPSHVKTSVSNTEAQALTSDGEFIDRVKEAKKYISSGDVYQLVLSRTFQVSCPDPMSAYMRLRVENPSPYMFYFQHPNFTLFGASPERCLEVSATNKDITLSPIAGTRRRGFNTNGQINSDLDNKIQLALTLDEKEIAEHIMLVDLARNDIAAVAQAGSRKVVQLLESEFYSHVIHLVSTVTGKLKPQYDALHAYQACMNMGTLTGSPKFRANQLIRQFENARRGFYGGAVGFLSTQGDLNTAIVIRSALVKNGQAYVQAGAGIVYDSDPQSECNETKHKAAAVLNVLTKEMEPSHA